MKRGMVAVAIALICLLNLNVLAEGSPDKMSDKNNLKEAMGIRVKSLSLSAGGNLVDFRYQVMDAQKALALSSKKDSNPYLIDQASGAILRTPNLAQVGNLRNSMKNPIAGKTYFMLFSNPGMLVKKGGKVTLIIGDVKTENILVE